MEGGGGMGRERWREGGQWEERDGGREEWCGGMKGGGPMDVTHIGLSLPMSVHARWTPFVGGRLCSRTVVPLVWCGGGPLVVGGSRSSWPFVSPC